MVWWQSHRRVPARGSPFWGMRSNTSVCMRRAATTMRRERQRETIARHKALRVPAARAAHSTRERRHGPAPAQGECHAIDRFGISGANTTVLPWINDSARSSNPETPANRFRDDLPRCFGKPLSRNGVGDEGIMGNRTRGCHPERRKNCQL